MHRRAVLTGLMVCPALARAAAAMPVVTSFSLLADMVRRIGGVAVTVTSLVPVDGDAHVYQPRPADLRAVMEAAVMVENGLGLEGWMQRLTTAGQFRGRVVVATRDVIPRRMQEGGGELTTDPHAWQDPRNGMIYARNIAVGLVEADPANADRFRAAGDRYAAEIARMDAWIEQTLSPIPAAARRIITTHDAFGYYGARFGIGFLAAEGISTDSEPSAKAIAALVAQIKREKIRAVFIENMTDPRFARMIAREAGARLGGTVYSDALSPEHGPAATYLDMLRHNTTLFAAAMRESG